MDPNEARLLKDLLFHQRLLCLAVVVDGAPLAGLLPFVVRPDLSGVVVHASRLARHTKGLTPGQPFGILIHAPDHPDVDPRQVARVSLEGEVQGLVAGTPSHEEARALYLSRFPDSEPIFALPDFALYELRFRQGRLVGGFARAINLSADSLRRVAQTG